jgi:hypothetical protein
MALKKLSEHIKALYNDVQNPNGTFSGYVDNAAAKTAKYLANKAISGNFFNPRTGILYKAISNAYRVEFKYGGIAEIYLGDTDQLDSYFPETRKSHYNPRDYPKYWEFILYGWGPRAGNVQVSHPMLSRWKPVLGTYINAILDYSSDKPRIESPFNPEVATGNLVFRHPGREGRNWYAEYEVDYKAYFYGELTKSTLSYIKKFRIE